MGLPMLPTPMNPTETAIAIPPVLSERDASSVLDNNHRRDCQLAGVDILRTIERDLTFGRARAWAHGHEDYDADGDPHRLARAADEAEGQAGAGAEAERGEGRGVGGLHRAEAGRDQE